VVTFQQHGERVTLGVASLRELQLAGAAFLTA
jgi:hypothetical protein